MTPRRGSSPRSAARRSASHAPPEWMPTMATLATPARPVLTCASKAAYSASASSREGSVGRVIIVEVLLQNDGGGAVVDDLAALGRNDGRRIALVDQHHRQIEAAVQLVGEAAAARAHLVLRAVGMGRQTDDQARRHPLGDQRADGVEARRVVDGADDRQGLRLADQGVPHRHADALDAEIKTEYRFHATRARSKGTAHQAWPASEVSISGSMPSSFMAAT